MCSSDLENGQAVVIPDVGKDRFTKLSMTYADVPTGTDLGDSQFEVKIHEGGGVAIRVGKEGLMRFKGRLITQKKEPIGMIGGEITSLQGKKVTHQFFTSKEGYVEVNGLKPGRYSVELYHLDYAPFEIHISERDAGILDIGDRVVIRND